MELSLNTETCRENVRPGDSRMTSSASRLWEHCFFQTRSIPAVLPVATFLNFNNFKKKKKKRLKCEISHDMHVEHMCLPIPSKTCNRMTDSGQSVLQVENNGCFCSQFHILFFLYTVMLPVLFGRNHYGIMKCFQIPSEVSFPGWCFCFWQIEEPLHHIMIITASLGISRTKLLIIIFWQTSLMSNGMHSV